MIKDEPPWVAIWTGELSSRTAYYHLVAIRIDDDGSFVSCRSDGRLEQFVDNHRDFVGYVEAYKSDSWMLVSGRRRGDGGP